MGDEVLEGHAPYVAGAMVALDHERLVAAIRVHVPSKCELAVGRITLGSEPRSPVLDVLDRSAVGQTADGATAGLVAPDWCVR